MTSPLGHQCAAGVERMQQLDPVTYRPLPSAATDTVGGRLRRMCEHCSQMTLVKKNGFFRQHASSQQGPGVDRGQSHGKLGEPARVRRRGT